MIEAAEVRIRDAIRDRVCWDPSAVVHSKLNSTLDRSGGIKDKPKNEVHNAMDPVWETVWLQVGVAVKNAMRTS